MKKINLELEKKQVFGIENNSYILSKVIYRLFKDSTHVFNDEDFNAICVNCINHPCLKYSADEMVVSSFQEMPSNHSNNVCPTNAITTKEGLFPIISEDLCFNCGLCVNRCIYGAINIEKDFAQVNKNTNYAFTFTEKAQKQELEKREENFKNIRKEVVYEPLTKSFLKSVYSSIYDLCRKNNNFENILVRNILLSLGIKAKIRAIGNNDIRFDLIGEQNNFTIIGEIDLGILDKLDLPRAILDNIAVLNSRYKINKSNIIPVIIIDEFPNKRSDFYEVIFDIFNITGIQIKVISLHYLLLLVLFRKKIVLSEIHDLFNISHQNYSILEDCLKYFPELQDIDPFLKTAYYSAIK